MKKYEAPTSNDFQPFSMEVEKKPDDISLKEVTGLHFEADLDAIQKQQNDININDDLREVGINPRSDFETIEKQVSYQYTRPEEIISQVDEFSKINSFANETPLTSSIEIKENKINEFENAEKNSIGVYKKAYDETQFHPPDCRYIIL